jgi:hypothetical protein
MSRNAWRGSGVMALSRREASVSSSASYSSLARLTSIEFQYRQNALNSSTRGSFSESNDVGSATNASSTEMT